MQKEEHKSTSILKISDLTHHKHLAESMPQLLGFYWSHLWQAGCPINLCRGNFSTNRWVNWYVFLFLTRQGEIKQDLDCRTVSSAHSFARCLIKVVLPEPGFTRRPGSPVYWLNISLQTFSMPFLFKYASWNNISLPWFSKRNCTTLWFRYFLLRILAAISIGESYYTYIRCSYPASIPQYKDNDKEH